jgi:hypothetical protein
MINLVEYLFFSISSFILPDITFGVLNMFFPNIISSRFFAISSSAFCFKAFITFSFNFFYNGHLLFLIIP